MALTPCSPALRSPVNGESAPEVEAERKARALLAGGCAVVPVFLLLIPDASVLGGERWPAPAAQVWRGVARALLSVTGVLAP